MNFRAKTNPLAIKHIPNPAQIVASRPECCARIWVSSFALAPRTNNRPNPPRAFPLRKTQRVHLCSCGRCLAPLETNLQNLYNWYDSKWRKTDTWKISHQFKSIPSCSTKPFQFWVLPGERQSLRWSRKLHRPRTLPEASVEMEKMFWSLMKLRIRSFPVGTT